MLEYWHTSTRTTIRMAVPFSSFRIPAAGMAVVALLAAQVLGAAPLAPAVSAADLSSGLAAYWSFDDVSGTTVRDSSGNGNNGTWLLGSKAVYVPGRVGRAASFDGAPGSTITMPFPQSVTGSFSVSVWTNLSSQNSNSATPSHHVYPAGGAGGDGFGIADNGSAWVLTGGTRSYANAGPTTLGQWALRTITYDQATGVFRQYINGAQVATASVAPGTAPNWNNNGRPPSHLRLSLAGYETNGLLDEVKIWSRALDASEVALEHSRGGTATSLPNSCTAWYQAGATTSGYYFIDADGAEGPGGPLQVYCDQATAGGGWMLVARSVAGGSGSSFGWYYPTGAVADMSQAYSMGVLATGAPFTEVLFGSTTGNNTWGTHAYTHPATNTQLAAAQREPIGIGAPAAARGGNAGFGMASWLGYTGQPRIFFARDVPGLEGYGLLASGWSLGYPDDQPVVGYNGYLHTRQGMIMVRNGNPSGAAVGAAGNARLNTATVQLLAVADAAPAKATSAGLPNGVATLRGSFAGVGLAGVQVRLGNSGQWVQVPSGSTVDIAAGYDVATQGQAALQLRTAAGAAIGAGTFTFTAVYPTGSYASALSVSTVLPAGGIVHDARLGAEAVASGSAAIPVELQGLLAQTPSGLLPLRAQADYRVQVQGAGSVVLLPDGTVAPQDGGSYIVRSSTAGTLSFSVRPAALPVGSAWAPIAVQVSSSQGTATGSLGLAAVAPYAALQLQATPAQRGGQPTLLITQAADIATHRHVFSALSSAPFFSLPFDGSALPRTSVAATSGSAGTQAYVAGGRGGALQLQGTASQAYTLASPTAVAGVALVYAPTQPGSSTAARTLLQATGPGGASMALAQAAGTRQLVWQLAGPGGASASLSVDASLWTAGTPVPLAVSWSAGTATLYAGGAQVAQAAFAPSSFTLDAISIGGGAGLAGSMDELHLFSTGITAADASRLAAYAQVETLPVVDVRLQVTNPGGFTITNAEQVPVTTTNTFFTSSSATSFPVQMLGSRLRWYADGQSTPSTLGITGTTGNITGSVQLVPGAPAGANALAALQLPQPLLLDEAPLDVNVNVTDRTTSIVRGNVTNLGGLDTVAMYVRDAGVSSAEGLEGDTRLRVNLDNVATLADLRDASGWQGAPTAVGTPALQPTPGRAAVRFAAGDALRWNTAAGMVSGEYTVDTWVRPGATAGTIFSLLDAGGTPIVTLGNTGTGGARLTMAQRNSSGTTYTCSPATPLLQAGQWSHVAMVVETTANMTSGAELYVDGQWVASCGNNAPITLPAIAQMRLGGGMAGLIGNTTVLARMLVDAEIEDLYESQKIITAGAVAPTSPIDAFGNWFISNANLPGGLLAVTMQGVSGSDAATRPSVPAQAYVRAAAPGAQYVSSHTYDITSFGITPAADVAVVLDGPANVLAGTTVAYDGSASADAGATGAGRVPAAYQWQFRVGGGAWVSSLPTSIGTVLGNTTAANMAVAVAQGPAGRSFDVRLQVTTVGGGYTSTSGDNCGDSNPRTFCATRTVNITAIFPVGNLRATPEGCGIAPDGLLRPRVRLSFDANPAGDGITGRAVYMGGAYNAIVGGTTGTSWVPLPSLSAGSVLVYTDEGRYLTAQIRNQAGVDVADVGTAFTTHYCSHAQAAAALAGGAPIAVPLYAQATTGDTVKLTVGEHKLPFPSVPGATASDIRSVTYDVRRNGQTVYVTSRDYGDATASQSRLQGGVEPGQAAVATPQRAFVYDASRLAGSGLALRLDGDAVAVRGTMGASNGSYALSGSVSSAGIGSLTLPANALTLELDYPFATLRGTLATSLGTLQFNREDGATDVVVDMRTGAFRGVTAGTAGALQFSRIVSLLQTDAGMRVYGTADLRRTNGTTEQVQFSLTAPNHIVFNNVAVDPGTKRLSGTAGGAFGTISFNQADGAAVYLAQDGKLHGTAKNIAPGTLGDVVFGTTAGATAAASATGSAWRLISELDLAAAGSGGSGQVSFRPALLPGRALQLDAFGSPTGAELVQGAAYRTGTGLALASLAGSDAIRISGSLYTLYSDGTEETFTSSPSGAALQLSISSKFVTGQLVGTRGNTLSFPAGSVVMDSYGALHGMATIATSSGLSFSYRLGSGTTAGVATGYAITQIDPARLLEVSGQDSVSPQLAQGTATWPTGGELYYTGSQGYGLRLAYTPANGRVVLQGSLGNPTWLGDASAGTATVDTQTKRLQGTLRLQHRSNGTYNTINFDAGSVYVSDDGSLRGTAPVLTQGGAAAGSVSFGGGIAANTGFAFLLRTGSTTATTADAVNVRDATYGSLTRDMFGGFQLCDGPSTQCSQGGAIPTSTLATALPPRPGSLQSYQVFVTVTYRVTRDDYVPFESSSVQFASAPAVLGLPSSPYASGVKLYDASLCEATAAYYIVPGYATDRFGGLLSYNVEEYIDAAGVAPCSFQGGRIGLFVQEDGSVRGAMLSQTHGIVSFEPTDGANVRLDPATGLLSGRAYIGTWGYIAFGEGGVVHAPRVLPGGYLVGEATSDTLGIVRFGAQNLKPINPTTGTASCPMAADTTNGFADIGQSCVWRPYLCDKGFIGGAACANKTARCILPNAIGKMTYNGSTWGACVVDRCLPGYNLVGGQCVSSCGGRTNGEVWTQQVSTQVESCPAPQQGSQTYRILQVYRCVAGTAQPMGAAYRGSQVGGSCGTTTPVVNGSCGSANGGSFTSATAANAAGLCAATGTQPAALTGTGPWAWTCTGTGSGSTNANCAASHTATAGTCGVAGTGGATYTTAAQVNAAGLCGVGTASPASVSGTGPWSWTCLGTNNAATTDDAVCNAGSGSMIIDQNAPVEVAKQGVYPSGGMDRFALGAMATTTDTLMIGDWFDTQVTATDTVTGALHLYNRAGNVWNYAQKIKVPYATSAGEYTNTGTDAAGGQIGITAGISGNVIAVAKPRVDYSMLNNNYWRPGEVYVYKKSGGTWSLAQTITRTTVGLPENNLTNLVDLVATSGNAIAIGNTVPTRTVSGTGTKGNPVTASWPDAGRVHLLVDSGSGYALQQTLTHPEPPTLDARGSSNGFFGKELVMEGNYLAVGASRNGAADVHYVYRRSGNTWNAVGLVQAQNNYGNANARVRVAGIANNELLITVSSPDAPATRQAHVERWDISGASPVYIGSIATPRHLSAHAVGTYLLVGDIYDDGYNTMGGAAYLYERQANGTYALQQKITSRSPSFFRQFGAHLLVDGSSSLLISSATQGTVGSLSAYPIRRDTTYGSCGAPAGERYSSQSELQSAPQAPMCVTGNVTNLQQSGTGWTWTCTGTNTTAPDSPMSCSALALPAGGRNLCGGFSGQTFGSVDWPRLRNAYQSGTGTSDDSSFCYGTATASGFSGSMGPVTWTCTNTRGQTESCTAEVVQQCVINGTCQNN